LPGSREVLVVKRFLAALACWGLLVLSSCSDDSSSSAEPPSPKPTSTSSEPSPTQEVETPEEFVRRWVEVDREMQNSGETTEYRRLTNGCTACEGVADQVDDIYAAGGYVKTAGLQIKGLRAGQPDSNGEVEVRLAVISTPTEYVEEAGGQKRTLPGGRVTYLVTLHASRSSYVITLLERLAE
jgi:hypothetical protein